MKLELLVASLLAVFVPFVAAQGDMLSLLQMMGFDVPSVRLPPRPPQTLVRYYQQQQQQKQSTYQQLQQKQQQVKEAQQQQRLQQELELLNRLRSMAPAEVEALKKKLTPSQLQQLVQRIKYLQQLEQQQKQAAGAEGTSSNLILSGANRIRTAAPLDAANAVSGSSSSSSGGSQPTLVTGPSSASAASPVSAAMSRRAQYINAMLTAFRKRMSASQKNNPMEMIRKYQSFQKKARNAIGAGCSYPMATEGSIETFMAFSGGGCAAGGAVCMMNGQSCVDVGMSIMCCPPGYTGGTLDMMSYMRQMETFMGQFA